MQSKLVIYHDHCLDGFTAAWLMRYAWPTAEFHPAQYGSAPPDVTDKNVLIADFSYSRDVLLEMKDKARSLLVLDHHVSAQRDLEGLDFCVFDMNQSGAGMVARHFREELEASDCQAVTYSGLSETLECIEAGDLWKWEQNLLAKDVQAAVGTFERTFFAWDELFETPVMDLALDGRAINKFRDNQVKLLAARAKPCTFTDLAFPSTLAVNCSVGALTSSVCHAIALEQPSGYGVSYTAKEDGRWQYSLRSIGDVDVSKLAKVYGGGGHKNAAGFISSTPVHIWANSK